MQEKNTLDELFKGKKGFAECYQTLQLLSESTDDYLFLADLKEGKFYFASNDISKRYALRMDENNSCSINDWKDIVYGRDLNQWVNDMESICSGKSLIHDLEYRLVDRNSNLVWISCRGKAELDETGIPYVMVGRTSDTVLLGKTDSLTGLFNSTKLMEHLDEMLNSRKEGVLLVLGVDNFKNINTKYGRGHGNFILKRIAALLENSIDENIKIYRLDGDRFAVNFVGYDMEAVREVYQNIQMKMMENCTFSAGAVCYPMSGIKDANTLFNYAESSLDRAKKSGKNRLILFSAEDYEKQLSVIDLTEEIRKSIRNQCDGFYLLFQPQIGMSNYEVVGAEALLRFRSKYHGVVSPNLFIGILEQSGMIVQVGKWVLKEAIAQCAKWRRYNPEFRMSINLSYIQLQQPDLSQYIYDLLEQEGIPGEAIILELTESMQLQDYTKYNQLFYQWGKRGIQISMDDFGTGYSSLSYLKSLAIDEIKIDRCFVSRINMSAYNYRLLRNIFELARSAQIRVVCEGVETPEELQTLAELAPEVLQGFYFSKPIEEELFEKQYIFGHVEEERWQEDCGNSTVILPEAGDGTDYKAILDQLEEMVYVLDVESYELYYMNSAGQRISGVSDYAGKKCYQVLEGREEPCPDCNTAKLKHKKFLSRYANNEFLGTQMLMKDKLVNWGNKAARLQIGIDMNTINISVSRLEEQLEVEKGIVKALEEAKEKENEADIISELLHHTGEFYQADRSYIFLYSKEADSWSNVCEWCENEIQSQQLYLASVPGDWVKLVIGSLKEDRPVIIKDVDMYRESAPDLWKILVHQEIRRLMLLPLLNEGHLFGFIGVDNPKYRPNDKTFLARIRPFISNILIRDGMMDVKSEMIARMTGMLKEENILQSVKLGLWTLELDTVNGKNRLYVDKSMRSILGIDDIMNSEEYFRFWYDNISDGYYDYVQNALHDIITTEKIIEMEYTWNHPERGKVTVRCVGVLGHQENGVYTLKGYHRINNDMIRKKFLKSQEYERMEYNEKKHTIYFHTNRSMLKGNQLKEVGFPESWEDGMVHPHFRDVFHAAFTGVEYGKEDQVLEILLKNKQDEFEWFRLDICKIGDQKQDENLRIVTIYQIEDHQNIQLKYLQREDFYQAMLSETVAYAEVDLSNGKIQSSGGLWKDYVAEGEREALNYMKVFNRHIDELVLEEDQVGCYDVLEQEKMVYNYNSGTATVNYQLRRRMARGSYHWMELTVHVFQEQVTENMYALLYLKDIDGQKRRQQEQERAANTDPLTNVLNRRIFEQYTSHYVLEEAKKGEVCALLILDIDNFKQINDTKGHPYGDKVLRTFVDTIHESFRRTDYIGRLGGDEFVVLFKGFGSKKTLDKRLARMQEQLREKLPTPVSCSVGITLIRKDSYNYEDSIRQADKALYTAKHKGKDTYCYWEESEK